tara:strand:+ start:2439 stop:3728 length:1290 start_codon:yes stop_codon:yes gene_type:complete
MARIDHKNQSSDQFSHAEKEPGQNRLLFIDYLRGFMVLLVVLEHSLLPYTKKFNWTWFFPDMTGTYVFDIWHYHNDTIMMPFLFFLAGMFVMPSLKRRGLASFMKERFLRLVVPFVFGVTFITPFLSYYKKRILEGLDTGFFEFWWGTYIRWEDYPFQNFTQGGFWFLYYLAVLTLALILLSCIIPKFMEGLGAFARFLMNRPIRGFICVCCMSAVILGASDLMWGAHWWFGFKPVFHVRTARFIIKIFYFFLGAGVSYAGFLENSRFLENLGKHWKKWLGVSILLGGGYMAYSLAYFEDGAYNNDVRLFFYRGGLWEYAWPVISQSAPPLLIRTTLLGCFMASLSVMYMSLFYRFLNTPKPFWVSLAACSYGIYIFHEPFTIWLHTLMYGEFISPFVKFLIAGGGSLGISWLLVSKVFLKLPGFKRIL